MKYLVEPVDSVFGVSAFCPSLNDGCFGAAFCGNYCPQYSFDCDYPSTSGKGNSSIFEIIN